MSFSSGVKEELALVNSPARHCAIALIAALFHLCPVLEQECAGIRTENRYAAAAFEAALRRVRFENIEVAKSGREITVQIAGKQQPRLDVPRLQEAGDGIAAQAESDGENSYVATDYMWESDWLPLIQQNPSS